MAISVKKIDEKDRAARYLVSDVSPSFINAVRRSIMQHTPCLAIEDITIYENGSVMFDELVAHRLAMLPLKTDKTYKLGDTVKLVLEKEGSCTVYSKDIKSTDPKIEVLDKNIPVTKLSKGQRLKIEMQAVVQTGKEHAKWQPAIAGYREVPSLEISKDCNGCEDCVKECPLNILEMKGKKVSLSEPLKCSLCGACVDACPKGAIKLSFDRNSFILMIEPIAGLTAKEVMRSAVKGLIEKTEELAKAIEKARE